MVQTRRMVARRADVATDQDEPLLELAKRKVAAEGGSLRLTLRALREERRERARQIALAEAPRAKPLTGGSFERVSSDPRWPFGVNEQDEIVAPFGFGVAGLPRVVAEEARRGSMRQGEANARRDARDIIMGKLARLGCDPIEIMAEIAMDKQNTKAEVRLRAASELATMVYPRLRGVEISQRDEKTVFVIGIPSERPADADAWLNQAEGPRRIAQAVTEADVIEGEVKVVEKS